MKKTIATFAAAAISMAGLYAQSVEEISASTTLAFESEYVFRGGKQFDKSIQPGLEVSHPAFDGDLYLGYWGAYNVENNDSTRFSESDVYVGYSQAVTDMFSVDGGFTYYGFYNTNGGQDQWKEVYFGVSADYMFSPSLYAFYNESGEAWTIELAGGHSFDLTQHAEGLSLDVGAYAGAAAFEDANGDQVAGTPEDGYTYWGTSADLVYTVNEVASVSLGVRYAGNNNNTRESNSNGNLYVFTNNEDLFWWGASASFGF